MVDPPPPLRPPFPTSNIIPAASDSPRPKWVSDTKNKRITDDFQGRGGKEEERGRGWTLEHFGQRRRRRDRVPSFFFLVCPRVGLKRGKEEGGVSKRWSLSPSRRRRLGEERNGSWGYCGMEKKGGLEKGMGRKGGLCVFPALVPGW